MSDVNANLQRRRHDLERYSPVETARRGGGWRSVEGSQRDNEIERCDDPASIRMSGRRHQHLLPQPPPPQQQQQQQPWWSMSLYVTGRPRLQEINSAGRPAGHTPACRQ